MHAVLFLNYTLTKTSDVFADHTWADALASIPGLYKTLAHRPAHIDDPFLAPDPTSSAASEYVLQLYFDSLTTLEDACSDHGALATTLQQLTSRTGTVITQTQQAMLLRRFAVPCPTTLPPIAQTITYLVSYSEPQGCHDIWLRTYLHQHVPLMARLPNIREVEVYTMVDFLSALPLTRAHAIQRNKVVFDDLFALQTALQSPLRAEMRADFLSLPHLGLTHTHHPKLTLNVSR